MRSVLAVLMLALGSPALAKTQYTTPMPAGAPLVIDSTAPDKKYTGPGMALVPNTSFIIIQTKGGSILLGPLLGAANVKANSRALAQKSVGGYMGVDVPAIATASLASIGVDALPKQDGYAVKPYAYVQQCADDEVYRVAAALDVTGPGTKNSWNGRYVVHLATPISYAQFLKPDEAQVSAFTTELTAAMDLAAQLMQRDQRGELPAGDGEVKFGSLNLVGNKLGGMGIYTPAKELWLTRVRLLEESDDRLVIRMYAHSSTLLYGMHSLARTQVHKLEK